MKQYIASNNSQSAHMKTTIIAVGITLLFFNFSFGQQAQYNVTAGNGNGLRFWNSDTYKIHMGNTSEYKYGPVTDYSIKMNMSNTPGRGWVWGVDGVEPVAALGNTGNFRTKGNIATAGNLDLAGTQGNGVRFYSENNNNNFKIHMGNGPEYKYGPVTDYSIKMNMSNTPGRGWVWGVNGVEPVAALNTQGNFQIKGNITTAGNLDLAATQGNGVRFWNGNNSYKIHMGKGPEYKYGPVTDVSIKTSMNSTPGRGWVWGVNDVEPVAALSNTGNFQIKGQLKTEGGITTEGNALAEGTMGVGTAPFEGVKMNIRQDVITAPTYGTTALFSFGSSSHTTGEISKVRGAWLMSLNNSSGILNESIGIDALAGNESSATGIVNSAYGINIDVQQGNGVVENGYGMFIKRVQANNSYGIYQQGETTKNYFAGNVSIGTTEEDPGYSLTVKGKIHVQEVKVDLEGVLSVPDYVFYEDYKLKTLPEVEAYIDQKGHLPNIPSATEMVEEGMNLKEMNLKLLEKIEELTLYTIAQEKAIKKQNAVSAKQEERLQKLEALLVKE